ncbi:DEAD/DEAH box helicase [Streptomyces sp. NPDC007983]|uniref:DEAD/DEAH box helicase n=1 Tax=Streptomyces sp. NPDC007983 TaxID=3364800 RepID=UPI0036ECAB29
MSRYARSPRKPRSHSRPPVRTSRPSDGGNEFALPRGTTPVLPAVATFAELDLPDGLAAELTHQGVTVPFPIQAATLPSALTGRDVLGRAQTGSGKTLAFGLALLARTAGQRAESRRPLGLVLVPTRELAQQVSDALTPYARRLRLRPATVVGGMSINRQADALRNGAEVVIATPGRLHDLIDRGDCRLDQVRITVLDEADQMADMGFLPQVTRLLRQVPADGQRMLFSATLDNNISKLVREFLTDPALHSVDPSAGAVTTMEHHVLHIADTDKRSVATRVAARDGRVIMFLDTKHAVDRLTRHLLANGVRAAALHGGKSQPQRTKTLERFKTGDVTALVATNVAARGIHVDDLDLVLNVDPPADHKDYLHRGGRTARAGGSGSVVTLVLPDQRRAMTRLMSDAGITPNTARVHSTDDELTRITGAQEPSGVPVTISAPAPRQAPGPRQARRGGGGGGSGRGSRGGSGRGTGAGAQRGTGSGSGRGTGSGSGGGAQRGSGGGAQRGGGGTGRGTGGGSGRGSGGGVARSRRSGR